MKKLLIVLAIAMMSLPAFGGIKRIERAQWFCYQMGQIEAAKILVTTPVHQNNKNIPLEQKAKEFEKGVTKLLGPDFTLQYNAYCIAYEEKKNAQEHLKAVLKRAKKLGFRILELPLELRKKR